MATGSSGNPYEHYGNDTIEQDLIDPDDGMIISGEKLPPAHSFLQLTSMISMTLLTTELP